MHKDIGAIKVNSAARVYAIQFLYQCECSRLFHFSGAHFSLFADHFKLPVAATYRTSALVRGIIENQDTLDRTIEKYSKNWKMGRMPTTDRYILRIASYELMEGETPYKVVINEAIDLAKRYGTKDSGAFVNAVLDRLATDGETSSSYKIQSR